MNFCVLWCDNHNCSFSLVPLESTTGKVTIRLRSIHKCMCSRNKCFWWLICIWWLIHTNCCCIELRLHLDIQTCPDDSSAEQSIFYHKRALQSSWCQLLQHYGCGSFKGLKSKTIKREIFLPVKELVSIDKSTQSIRFWSLSLFC